jgi:hypothetical protein
MIWTEARPVDSLVACLDSEPHTISAVGLETFGTKSRLGALLEHFAAIDHPRDVRRILHPLAEVLLLVVCAPIADCDDYDAMSAWAKRISSSFAGISRTPTVSPAGAG